MTTTNDDKDSGAALRVQDAGSIAESVAVPIINDGGPAFPQSVTMIDGRPVASYDLQDAMGITVRDYFAAKALSSLGEDVHSVLYHAERSVDGDGDETERSAHRSQAARAARTIAIATGIIADAMLKERAK